MVENHRLVLEEKSLVSKAARDDLGVKTDFSNFEKSGIRERVGDIRDLRLSAGEHIEKNCAYREIPSLHRCVPGSTRRLNDLTFNGCGWSEADSEGELEVFDRIPVLVESAELCFASSSNHGAELGKLFLYSLLVSRVGKEGATCAKISRKEVKWAGAGWSLGRVIRLEAAVGCPVYRSDFSTRKL